MDQSTIMHEYIKLLPNVFADFQNLSANMPLSHLQLIVIDMLSSSGTPLAVKTLRDHVQTSRQQLNAVLNTLQAAGYITRTPNPDDGRSVLIALTPAGQDLNQTRWETVASRTNQRLARLSDEQQLELYYCLHKLNGLLGDMRTND
ncbi:MarR family winged helix-turn-helix transcriptional regulator [Lacticaseibacillus porcinae]|uniref:MarR family winged helix-turn-helix transcriptional regulator n=1 Tax=Lacticaseibacillus porcinae TaxID=1123687 RepID=UPI000F7A53E0|nr:MarR family transcriptional regulator [Lacticaseibacillus porcinae]